MSRVRSAGVRHLFSEVVASGKKAVYDLFNTSGTVRQVWRVRSATYRKPTGQCFVICLVCLLLTGTRKVKSNYEGILRTGRKNTARGVSSPDPCPHTKRVALEMKIGCLFA